MESLSWLLPELSRGEWAVHLLFFAVNIGLLLLARPILNLAEESAVSESKLKIFTSLNILVLVLHGIDIVLLRITSEYQSYFIDVGLSLMTMYAAMFAYTLSCSLSKKRFGNKRTLDDKVIYTETYSTRLVNLILLCIIVPSAIYVLIKIWGADSMLEATGIVGIIAALLAFSSSIWAPDIVSGLIILNTQMLEDGDVVVIDGFPDEYIITKVTLFYVVLYDVRNNHRTLLRNSQFTGRKIDNLSKVASTDGIRQSIKYNIGYPAMPQETNSDAKDEALRAFIAKVDKMFDRANRQCVEDENVKINENKDFEWGLTSTGDDALEYTLWVYLERIPNTKVTATIRKHLMRTLFKVNESVYHASIGEGLDLSTPKLTSVSIQSPPAPIPQTLAPSK
ncbi:MAG: mechanosensitive ion channel domain-containing protein [Halioglobus sp.]